MMLEVFLALRMHPDPRAGRDSVLLQDLDLFGGRHAVARVTGDGQPGHEVAEGRGLDVITAVFLFHELPAKVRRAVAAEAARLLKPGGLFLLVDSLQLGDVPEYDGLIEYFPVAFHEPYYLEYAKSDLEALFSEAGLRTEDVTLAYFSRVMTLCKPK